MNPNKKAILAGILTASSILAIGQAAAETQSGVVTVSYAPTISLTGTAFTTPLAPTLSQLEYQSTYTVGTYEVTSNTQNCSMALDTDNGFRLMSGTDVISTFKLTAMGLAWDSTNAGTPVVNACTAYASGNIQFTSLTYDPNVPAGDYTDTIHMTVMNQ